MTITADELDGINYVIGENRADAVRACHRLDIPPRFALAARNVQRAIEGTHGARVILVDPWTRLDTYNQVMATLRASSAIIVRE